MPEACVTIKSLCCKEVFTLLQRSLWVLFLVVFACPVLAQSALGDLLSGRLVAPEKGVWAWYELLDKATGQKFYLRQAVVDEEKVKRKAGYWVETQIQPEAGFGTVYKMLLTGPATDPKNIQRLIVQDGANLPEEIPVDTKGADGDTYEEGAQELVGTETITTPQGELECQRFVIEEPEGTTELWVNETVRPLGLVKMISPEGELTLQRFGKDGADAASVIDLMPADDKKKDKSDGNFEIRVETGTGDGPSRNFQGRRR